MNTNLGEGKLLHISLIVDIGASHPFLAILEEDDGGKLLGPRARVHLVPG